MIFLPICTGVQIVLGLTTSTLAGLSFKHSQGVTWLHAWGHSQSQWKILEEPGQTWSLCLRILEQRLDSLQHGRD